MKRIGLFFCVYIWKIIFAKGSFRRGFLRFLKTWIVGNFSCPVKTLILAILSHIIINLTRVPHCPYARACTIFTAGTSKRYTPRRHPNRRLQSKHDVMSLNISDLANNVFILKYYYWIPSRGILGMLLLMYNEMLQHYDFLDVVLLRMIQYL